MGFSPARQRWWIIAAVTALIALPFLAFGRSLMFGFAPIDDAYLVVQNLATRGPTLAHLKTAFSTFDPELYIPLTIVSFQINFLISGLLPWSYHLANILLHGCNAALLFLIFKKITGAPRVSLFAAALFAVHPINAEAVVWITARKDLLSTFFALASTLAFLRQTQRSLPLSIVLFLCALLAKVSVAPLPLIFPILLRIQEGKWSKRAALSAIPFVLLSILFVLIGLLGKAHIMQISHPGEILLLIPRSIFFLLGKFLLPKGLSPLYEVTDLVALSNPTIFIPLFVFLCFICFLCFFCFLRKKSLPLLLTLTLTFVLLTPAFLTFRKAGTIFLTTDRYLYLPELGLLLLIALLLKNIGGRFTVPKPAIAGVGGFLLAFLTVLSMKQTSLWNSPEALFAHALEANPRSVAARTALAQVTLSAGKPEQAFSILKEGLKLGDDPRLHLMAGNVYASTGQITDALAQFEKVTLLEPGNVDAWFSIGSIKEQTGKEDEALGDYFTAVSLDPSDVPARNGIGRILLKRNDIEGAEQQFRTALEWNPNSVDAHRGLAPVLAKTGRVDEAEFHRNLANELSLPH